jgi:NAD(P)-dependent dehydrogenase (short-subunit alcohol dehydrogenase family)
MRLADKVAIISGGGTGIGAATARLFAEEGASVVVTGRRQEPLQAVATEIGGVAVAGNVSDPEHVRTAVDAAVDRFGGLDIVVANAGAGYGGAIADLTDEEWSKTIDVNLTGAFTLTRAALPHLIDRGGGSIVLVSSIAGLGSFPEEAAYSTTKAAMLGLARSIAADYGRYGVRANTLCPGWVRTPMGDRAMDWLAGLRGVDREAAYRIATAATPLRRPAEAAEIASCCLFLASDESSFVTGSVLVADGGNRAVDVASQVFDEHGEDAPGQRA